MKTQISIREANANGRLGLILYSIPNYPSPEIYRSTIELITKLPFVSAIEMTFPVTGSFSEHANSTIVESHRIAAAYTETLEQTVNHLTTEKPLICVLYKKTIENISFNNFLKIAAPKIDGILLEWSEKDETPFMNMAHEKGVQFIPCVGPWMSLEAVSKIIEGSPPEALVYLMSAPMTGGSLFAPREIERCVNNIRQFRPNAVIAAGFGVRTAEDIKALATVKGLNAVIVGTGFLAKLREGSNYLVEYLGTLRGVLKYV